MSIEYAIEPQLSAEEFVDVLRRSGLAERRPVDDAACIQQMLRGAGLIVTAREAGRLIGIARSLSDGAYCTYLSDLAVDKEWQRRGIGRELLRQTHQYAGAQTNLILLSAPAAREYYPHIGMQQHNSCWIEYGTRKSPQSSAEAIPIAVANLSSEVESRKANFGVVDVPPVKDEPQKENGEDNHVATASEEDTGLGRFFDAMAGDYATAILRCFPRYNEMLWALLDYLPSQEPRRILELGCGTGNLSVLLAERFPQAQITLVDLSAHSIAVCRQRLGQDQRFVAEVGDMRQLGYPAGHFDLIISSIAIHHLTPQEKQALFANCHAWLTDKGVLAYADQFAAACDRTYQRHMENWKSISRQAGATEEEWSMWMEHAELYDHHDSLTAQLQWLQAAGFHALDVPWRYLLWTVVLATRETDVPSSTF